MNTFPYIKHTPDGHVFFGIDPATKTWSRFLTRADAEAWLKVPCVADEDGNYTFTLPVHSSQIVELASSILEASLIRGDLFSSPQCARDFAQLQLGALEHEVFGALFLDNRHRLIEFERLFTGTIGSTSVYPREVVKRTLAVNAAAVIFTHNHPSGDTDPSTADQTITKRLKDALALIDVRVLDHIVVSATETTSMSERGFL